MFKDPNSTKRQADSGRISTTIVDKIVGTTLMHNKVEPLFPISMLHNYILQKTCTKCHCDSHFFHSVFINSEPTLKWGEGGGGT